MATALTPGKIYFIESNAVDNQDWITNNAGDPDAIDLDTFTEGTEYCQMDIPIGFARFSHTGAVVTPSGSGNSFDLRSANRFYKTMLNGIQTSLANANLIDKFLMSDRHTSGASATFVRYYLIVYFATNSHLEFTDSNNAQKSYCKGIILKVTTQWVDSDNLNFTLRINWASVW